MLSVVKRVTALLQIIIQCFPVPLMALELREQLNESVLGKLNVTNVDGFKEIKWN